MYADWIKWIHNIFSSQYGALLGNYTAHRTLAFWGWPPFFSLILLFFTAMSFFLFCARGELSTFAIFLNNMYAQYKVCWKNFIRMIYQENQFLNFLNTMKACGRKIRTIRSIKLSGRLRRQAFNSLQNFSGLTLATVSNVLIATHIQLVSCGLRASNWKRSFYMRRFMFYFALTS